MRLYAFALGIAGEQRVRELIRNMEAEFDLMMGLAGCAAISEIMRERLRRAD